MRATPNSDQEIVILYVVLVLPFSDSQTKRDFVVALMLQFTRGLFPNGSETRTGQQRYQVENKKPFANHLSAADRLSGNQDAFSQL